MEENTQQSTEMQFHQPNEFSLVKIYEIKDFIKQIWNIGLITYGGPMAHLGIFRKKFIQQMNCITDDQFTQLIAICQSIPGPTSTQVLIAISMYATASFWGGLLAFLMFSLPTFFVMMICGLSISSLVNIQIIETILPGLRVVAIAIILQAFYRLFTKIVHQKVMIIVVLCSSISYYFFRNFGTLLILFATAGLTGYFLTKLPTTDNNILIADRFRSRVFGLKNLGIFAVLLALAFFILGRTDNVNLIVFGVFYKIGSLAIGGGHVILPLMYVSFSPYGLIKQEDFANGFSVISALPGPMFNLSVYIGTFIQQSVIGGIIAYLGLFLPCFLFIMTILPYWEAYRSLYSLKKIMNGICCASIGLILVTAIILWEQQSFKEEGIFWPIGTTLLVMGSFVLLQRDWGIPLVFVIGAGVYLLMAQIRD